MSEEECKRRKRRGPLLLVLFTAIIAVLILTAAVGYRYLTMERQQKQDTEQPDKTIKEAIKEQKKQEEENAQEQKETEEKTEKEDKEETEDHQKNVIASADKDQLTGLKEGDTYQADARISFEAIGDGMDNEMPMEGDTRYIPMNWTVFGTQSKTILWDSEPYRASFGIRMNGEYTLEVAYRLQEFDGRGWKNQEEYDKKNVTFTVTGASEERTAVPTEVPSVKQQTLEEIQRLENTASQTADSSQLYAIWDGELNKIWGILKNTLDVERMEQLRSEQISWIKNKEAHPSQAAELTQERVYYLLEYLPGELTSENTEQEEPQEEMYLYPDGDQDVAAENTEDVVLTEEDTHGKAEAARLAKEKLGYSGEMEEFRAEQSDVVIYYPVEWKEHLYFRETENGVSINSSDKYNCAEMMGWEPGYWRHTPLMIAKVYYQYTDTASCFVSISDPSSPVRSEDLDFKAVGSGDELYVVSGTSNSMVVFLEDDNTDPEEWKQFDNYDPTLCDNYAEAYTKIIDNRDILFAGICIGTNS